MLSQKKTAITIFLLAVFLLTIDRFLKILALNQIQEYSLIADILKFNFAKNYFIAFSLPLSGGILIAIIIAIIMFLLGYSIKLAKKREFIQVALLANILLGASSNLFDRFKYAYVIDYIDLKYFTVFNVADAMIVGAVFLLLFSSWRSEVNLKKESFK